jgi:hypothetical protein
MTKRVGSRAISVTIRTLSKRGSSHTGDHMVARDRFDVPRDGARRAEPSAVVRPTPAVHQDN